MKIGYSESFGYINFYSKSCVLDYLNVPVVIFEGGIYLLQRKEKGFT